MAHAKNISDQVQHFVGIGTFNPQEVVPVTDEQAELLAKSPSMEIIKNVQPTKKFKGTDRPSSMRAVEPD